jgi:hypothetical protein
MKAGAASPSSLAGAISPLNYALGFTRIPLVAYVVASRVARAPGTFAYTRLGNAGCAIVREVTSQMPSRLGSDRCRPRMMSSSAAPTVVAVCFHRNGLASCNSARPVETRANPC